MRGVVRLAFGRSQSLEWVKREATGRSSDERWRRIGELFDEAHSALPLLEVDLDRAVFVVEVLRVIDKRREFGPPAWIRGQGESNVWRLGKYFREFPDPDEMSVGEAQSTPPPSVEIELTAQSVRSGRINIVEAIQGWKVAHRTTRNTGARGNGVGTAEFHEFCLNESCLGMREGLSQLGVTDPDGAIRGIKPIDCPGLWLYLRAASEYGRVQESTHAHDVFDWTQSHIPPYVNYCLLERRLADLLNKVEPCVRGRVHSDCIRLVETIDALLAPRR
ncbi:MAG: hypothetical protein KJZ69_02875 [Phycisphaerales bacterium]|nr:hypothetical protein [Phycisphaerales bacterium]